MLKAIMNATIVKQASIFGVRFLHNNEYVIKPQHIENLCSEELFHYSVYEDDQQLFDSFSEFFYNTYREVKFHQLSVYIRKSVKVGDFVTIGNEVYYLIDENSIVSSTSNQMNSKEMMKMMNLFSKPLERDKHLTKAFYS